MFNTGKYFWRYKTPPHSKRYNMVAMDKSGKFLFPDISVAMEEISGVLKQDKNCSLVPYSSSSVTKIHFDIDKTGELSIDDIKSTINDVLCEHFVNLPARYILKNKSYEKFHIYYDKIIKKADLKRLNEIVNAKLIKVQAQQGMSKSSIITAIVDESLMNKEHGCLLRLEGFNKYNHHTNAYEKNTYYEMFEPKNMKINSDFLMKINLLVEDETHVIEMMKPISNVNLSKVHEGLNCNISEDIRVNKSNSNCNSNSNFDSHVNNNDKDYNASENHDPSKDDFALFHSLSLSPSNTKILDATNKTSDIHDVGRFFQDISQSDNDDTNQSNDKLEDLKERYPQLFAFLEEQNFPVRQNGTIEQESRIIFDFDKSDEGKKCPFKQESHNNNNLFLVYFKDTEKLFQKCRSSACTDLSRLLWKDGVINDDFEDDLSMLTDDAMAKKFADRCGDEWKYLNKTDGKETYEWAHHDGRCWKFEDSEQTTLHHYIANHFKRAILSDLNYLQENGKISEKKSRIMKKSIRRFTETHAKRVSMIKSAKGYLKKHVDVDGDPYNFIFTNGVYNVKEATFRSSTDPNEYVVAVQHVDYAYISKDELDEETNKEMRLVLEHSLPDKEDKDRRQMMLGTGIIAIRPRDLLYQYSPKGHSGKSISTSLLLAVTGEESHNYGYRTSKNAFGKHEDRATKAAMGSKRAIVFEEPAQDSPMNGNDLDRFIGAGTFNARKNYSNECINKSYGTIIINSNYPVETTIYPLKEATKDKIVPISYPNRYVENPQDVDEANNKFLRQSHLSDKEWFLKMRPYAFHFLVDGVAMFGACNRIIPKKLSVTNSLSTAIVDARNVEKWLADQIVKTDNAKEGILLSDLVTKYKSSSYHQSKSLRERRESVSKFLETNIRSHDNLKNNFCEGHKRLQGKTFFKVICGYEWKRDTDKKNLSIASKIRNSAGNNADDADTNMEGESEVGTERLEEKEGLETHKNSICSIFDFGIDSDILAQTSTSSNRNNLTMMSDEFEFEFASQSDSNVIESSNKASESNISFLKSRMSSVVDEDNEDFASPPQKKQKK